MKYAAVKFNWSKDDKTFDYIVNDDMEIAPGDSVIVETKRGEATVEVVAVKDESELATKPILRKADPKPEPTEPEMDF